MPLEKHPISLRLLRSIASLHNIRPALMMVLAEADTVHSFSALSTVPEENLILSVLFPERLYQNTSTMENSGDVHRRKGKRSTRRHGS